MYKDKRGGGGWDKKKSFGGGRDNRGFDRPELHDATCNACGKSCKVPFRPNGKKPIYCSDCFKREGGGDERKSFDRPSYGDKPSYGEKRPYVSTPRSDTGKMESRLKAIEEKLDLLIDALSDDTDM